MKVILYTVMMVLFLCSPVSGSMYIQNQGADSGNMYVRGMHGGVASVVLSKTVPVNGGIIYCFESNRDLLPWPASQPSLSCVFVPTHQASVLNQTTPR